MFCGRRGDCADRLSSALRSSPVRAQARWIEEPLESEMPSLLASASVLVQLTREAWTPVTPLEAFAQGVAVVASRLDCFVEALGDQAEYVDADRDAPIDQGLDQALERTFAARCNPQADVARRALARSFTWAASARSTLAVYACAARARG